MAIERIVPGTKEWDAFYANHIMRYQFAVQELKKINAATILDAACGVGYGAAFIAREIPVKKVIAVDRSKEALDIANKNFKTNNLEFLTDDCHTLQTAAGHAPYDAVVSFETFEHLPKPADFLAACYSNLKIGGSIIISTPNKSVSSPQELNWEYHEKEYTATELFESLSAAGFKNISLYGQQFNMKGIIKNEVRGELNRLFSNPFVRAGMWIQSKLKGHSFGPVLKECIDDFEIAAYNNPSVCEEKGLAGPFVLIAVAQK
jgi:SAM-dependent methyltransferase